MQFKPRQSTLAATLSPKSSMPRPTSGSTMMSGPVQIESIQLPSVKQVTLVELGSANFHKRETRAVIGSLVPSSSGYVMETSSTSFLSHTPALRVRSQLLTQWRDLLIATAEAADPDNERRRGYSEVQDMTKGNRSNARWKAHLKSGNLSHMFVGTTGKRWDRELARDVAVDTLTLGRRPLADFDTAKRRSFESSGSKRFCAS